jgi:MarR-like DNA-binding transcriptional regulator SgrR of sgrS sRNA
MREILAGLMRNGSRLERSSIAVHNRLAASELTTPEFRERLYSAHKDEERHATTQLVLAERLLPGVPAIHGNGIRRMVQEALNADREWAMIALNLMERAFEVRLRAIARISRQHGFTFMYEPLMETAKDEERHVRMVTDMLRSGSRVDPYHVHGVAAWLTAEEQHDRSGFFPLDNLVPLMAHRLIQEITR